MTTTDSYAYNRAMASFIKSNIITEILHDRHTKEREYNIIQKFISVYVRWRIELLLYANPENLFTLMQKSTNTENESEYNVGTYYKKHVQICTLLCKIKNIILV